MRASQLVLFLLIGAGLVYGVQQIQLSRARAASSPDVQSTNSSAAATSAQAASTVRPSASEAIGSFRVRNLEGEVVPLVTPGEPAIIMVSSVTCSWCKRVLKDLGAMSGGRPLPHLKLLTLEGAGSGVAMLAKERITGAQLIGPAGSRDQVLLTFRYPGTPTFVAIDRDGRVAATIPGYLTRDVLTRWFAVMVGDQDVP